MSQEQVLFNLKEAATLYKRKKGLVGAGTVSPVYEKLGPQFSEGDTQIGENGNTYSMLIKRQEGGPRYSSPVAFIARRDITNTLGIMDCLYYFMVFRKKMSKWWADTLDISKYQGRPGIFLPVSILDRIENSNARFVSTLVLLLGDGRVYETPATKVFDFIKPLKTFLFINAYGQICTGVPLDLFKEDLA